MSCGDHGRNAAVIAAGALAVLAACASSGPAIVSRVDPRSAVTIIAMTAPLEYVSSPSDTSPEGNLDVAIGPFETDEMGKRRFFLWLGLAADTSASAPAVRLLAGDTVLLERSASSAIPSPPVSTAPYPGPAPWARHYYYPLSVEDLRALGGRGPLQVELAVASTAWRRLEAWSAKATSFDPFVQRVLSGS